MEEWTLKPSICVCVCDWEKVDQISGHNGVQFDKTFKFANLFWEKVYNWSSNVSEITRRMKKKYHPDRCTRLISEKFQSYMERGNKSKHFYLNNFLKEQNCTSGILCIMFVVCFLYFSHFDILVAFFNYVVLFTLFFSFFCFWLLSIFVFHFLLFLSLVFLSFCFVLYIFSLTQISPSTFTTSLSPSFPLFFFSLLLDDVQRRV